MSHRQCVERAVSAKPAQRPGVAAIDSPEPSVETEDGRNSVKRGDSRRTHCAVNLEAVADYAVFRVVGVVNAKVVPEFLNQHAEKVLVQSTRESQCCTRFVRLRGLAAAVHSIPSFLWESSATGCTKKRCLSSSPILLYATPRAASPSVTREQSISPANS